MKPVSRTAFYCCGIRALDASGPRPVCGDFLATRFMDDEAWAAFEPFRHPDVEKANASNVARHRIIDDLLRARLETDPRHRVVTIGAGFDTRPYRLGGGRWLEWDEPQLMVYKEERLPMREAPAPLERCSIDFATESLAERLRPHATGETVTVVVEGVMMYLTTEQVRGLARAARSAFPQVTLLADLMSRAFFRKYAGPVHQRLQGLGAMFAEMGDQHPKALLEAEGFRALASHSIVRRSIEERISRLHVPLWMVDIFMRSLRDGYAVWEFAAP